MLEGSHAGEQGEPRDRALASVDEGAIRLRMMQAGHASGDRNSKPEKNH
jgi:hypothetical protein